MTKLCLPNCSSSLVPASLIESDECISLNAPAESSIDAWQNMFNAACISKPDVILGGDNTPALAWLLARRLFPDARALCFETPMNHWRDLDSLDVWQAQPAYEKLDKTTAEVTENPAPSSVNQSQPIQAKNAPPPAKANTSFNHQSPSLKSLTDADLLYQIFQKSAWGSQKHTIEALMLEVSDRIGRNPSLSKAAIKRKLSGEAAFSLVQEAEKKLKTLFSKQAATALETVLNDYATDPRAQHRAVKKHLRTQLQKTEAFLLKKRRMTPRDQQVEASTLPPVVLRNGIHPNSLRHLQPSDEWIVAVDETGNTFDETASALKLNDAQLGRVVALIVPQRSYRVLADSPQNFHAADAIKSSELDQLVEQILNADVGVFGFTHKDQGLTLRQRWFDAINQLAYWVMLLLPIESNKATTVKFKIEARDYEPGDGLLRLIQEDLVSRLRTLDSQRFDQVFVSMAFVSKVNGEYNGYIDTIAHTWGSQASHSKQRLKRAGWAGHCLLTPNSEALERLFLAIPAHSPLEAEHWYSICSAIAAEPKTSLLHEQLARLGEQAMQNVSLWQSYMNYVSQRLSTKNYHLDELAATLQWLDTFKPQTQTFSLLENLYLKSSQLAHLNHQGKVDYSLVKEVFALADRLREENAHESAQVILRIATMTTNNFEFSAAQTQLEKWLNLDKAIPGLINYAKLHSALGQLFAFQHNYEQACHNFDLALSHFNNVSNPKLVEKDKAQTTIYLLITQMDQANTGWEKAVENWLSMQLKNIKQLARSGHNERYIQHTLLRAFICNPQYFNSLIQTYLDVENEWQSDEDHLWQWINAYRGWLWALQGNTEQATRFFNRAIEACFAEEKGITIRWIGAVITLLAKKLGLSVTLAALADEYIQSLAQECPQLPFSDLIDWLKDPSPSDHATCLARLSNLTPFNFH